MGRGQRRGVARAVLRSRPRHRCGCCRDWVRGAGPVGAILHNCTFNRDPPLEDPRNHAETPRRSTPVKLSHVQTGLLCTWVLLHEGLYTVGPGESGDDSLG